jgi:MSHA biogenesis protein MshI
LNKRAFLSLLRREPAETGSIGLWLSPDGIALARVVRSNGVPRLTACDYRPVPRAAEPAYILRGLVNGLGTDSGRFHCVLGPSEYQLLLVDTPDVPASELREAVRWRIHDLVDMPLDDATIDVFDMPQQISHGEAKPRTLCVVAARSPLIAQKVALLARGGCEVTSIDIAELALRNLTALMPEDRDGMVVLHLEQDYSLIVVTRASTLYLSRRIAVGQQALSAAVARAGEDEELSRLLEMLTEEVYRSLEYCESRFQALTPSSIVLTPAARLVHGLREGLAESTGLPVRGLDLDTLMPGGIKVPPERQAMCLLAVGAALRTESKTL